MVRRKKQEVDSSIASHEDAVVAFTNHCFKNGQGACISPKFDEVYEIGETSYKFTEQVLAEVLDSGRVIVTFQNDKEVHLRGVEVE